ncbi:MAG: glycosyltransferase family 4 protein [Rhodocyclaceae bacterium]|nr:glycosyltransferase family 4 protein [Rhodocyclaceae bacterium]
MRILQILHNHKAGGAENHLVALSEGLRARGHEIEFAGAACSRVAEMMAAAGFSVHDLDFRGHYDLPALFKLVTLARRNRFDLIHTHLVRAARYGRLAARASGTPLTCTVHDLLSWRHYPRRHCLIAVSDAVRQNLIGKGFERERIRVIHPGARDCGLGEGAAEARAQTRAELGIDEDTIAIGIIGRVAEVKAHDVALDAIGQLATLTARPFCLLVVGPITGWGRALQAGCTRPEVRWLGARQDIPRLLAAIDICIQPSHSEGMPLALMEAASAAKPVVASRVGGVPEIIEHERSGLLVPPRSTGELAAALARLIERPLEARRYGECLHGRFASDFSLAVMVQRTEQHYRTLLELAA